MLLLHPLLGLILGIGAGAIAAGVFYWPVPYPWFKAQLVTGQVKPSDGPPSGETPEQTAKRLRAESNNAMFAVGVAGVLIGGFLGLGEGLARRSGREAIVLALLGSILGGLFGAVGGMVGHHLAITYEFNLSMSELGRTMLIHGTALVSLCAGVALGVSLATRSVAMISRNLVAGILAGILATLLFTVVTSFAFPGVRTQTVIPQGSGSELASALLVWLAATGGLVGLMVPALGRAQH